MTAAVVTEEMHQAANRRPIADPAAVEKFSEGLARIRDAVIEPVTAPGPEWHASFQP